MASRTTKIIAAVILAPFVAVSVLELVSIAIRPISLSFRFYGNLDTTHPGLAIWLARLFSLPGLLGIALVFGLLLFVVVKQYSR